MTLNMNRLNFPNMVDRQLKETVTPVETYFDPLIISARAKRVEPKRNISKSKTPNTNIETSLKSILNTVHSKMKHVLPVKRDYKPEPPLSTTTSATVTNTVPQIKPAFSKAKSQTEIPKSTFQLNLNKIGVPWEKTPPEQLNGFSLASTSIPQLKADREQRSQMRLRRNITDYETQFREVNKKRITEVLKQKRILKEMLDQHHQLRRDRETIAVEIQTMRGQLNEIRNRLDKSLKRLSTDYGLPDRNSRPRKPLPKIPNRNINSRSYSLGTPTSGTRAVSGGGGGRGDFGVSSKYNSPNGKKTKAKVNTNLRPSLKETSPVRQSNSKKTQRTVSLDRCLLKN